MFKKNVEPNTGTHGLCFLIVGVRRPVFSTTEDSDPSQFWRLLSSYFTTAKGKQPKTLIQTRGAAGAAINLTFGSGEV